MMEELGKAPEHPFTRLPAPEIPQADQNLVIPDEKQCLEFWDKYHMLPNIRAHSLLVAKICEKLAMRAAQLGFNISIAACRAAGLLHDLAKTWCLSHGGNHGMLGSSWVIMETGNYAIGQGVLLHVHWPWELPKGKAICSLPIFVLYADKRVRHDQCVTVGERFTDLLDRYGKTEAARLGIMATHRQTLELQAALSKELNWSLDEDTFN